MRSLLIVIVEGDWVGFDTTLAKGIFNAPDVKGVTVLSPSRYEAAKVLPPNYKVQVTFGEEVPFINPR